MKKIVAISISIIVLFIGIYCAVIDTKQTVFNLNNGVKITTTLEYNKLNSIYTATVRVENRWVENGLLDFFNPVLIKVTGLTADNVKRVDTVYYYRNFKNYGNYYESRKSTDQMKYKTFKEIKRVEISTLMEDW